MKTFEHYQSYINKGWTIILKKIIIKSKQREYKSGSDTWKLFERNE